MAAASDALTLGGELVEIGKRSASMQYQLVHLSVDFDESGEWSINFPTAAHWIAARLDFEVSTAREWLRIGRALRKFTLLDAAFRDQTLSYSKVRTLSRFIDVENEAELCELGTKYAAGQLNVELAKWSAQKEDPERIKHRQKRNRGLSLSVQPDGSVSGHFNLAALQGMQLIQAVDTRVRNTSADASKDATLYQLRADALTDLVMAGGSDIQTEIILHVRGDGCTFDNGAPIAGSIVEQLAPKAFMRALIHDAESHPVNASGRQRHPTTKQERVVKERDKVCIDCGGGTFFEYDHNPPYSQSKHTVVDELYLRCSRCHKRRHNGGTVKS